MIVCNESLDQIDQIDIRNSRLFKIFRQSYFASLIYVIF